MLLVHEHEANIYRIGKYVNEAQYSEDIPAVLFCWVEIFSEEKNLLYI